jgi:predicted PurR-regulated permease PerM
MQQESLIQKYLSALFILILGIFLFLGIKEFFTAFLGAIVFYVLFKEMMYRMTRRKKINRSIAAVIIIIISFFIVVLPLGIIVAVILNKVTAVADNPESIRHFIDQITSQLNNLPIKITTKNFGERTTAFITEHIGDVLTGSLDMLGILLMMYFFLYFLLINTHALEARIVYYLPFEKSKLLLFGKELVDQTYSNAIGVPSVALAQGAFGYVAYLIAGVPEAGLWAILTGFASIIPLVGTALIWLPISIFLLVEAKVWQGVFVLVFSAVALGNVDNLIRMMISKRIGDVHPVVTVLGVILGLKYFGLPGLVFGPLLISYFLLLIKLYYIEYMVNKPIVRPGTPKQQDGLITRMLRKLI